ncbi:hypothetical protein G9A89_023349 [Geosiphon pyriformis]|nr:hypothetical protein G9A89_023349 [Geosiphon pyriformis]
MNKFDGLWVFTSGLDVGFYDIRVAIIMNNSLAQHVSKVDEIPGHLIFVHLLFKNKLSVIILDLYAGASIGTQFSQAANINSMVSKVVNSSFFVVLGGDFNENVFNKSVSFKFCLGLGLVNTFDGHLLAKASTWSNFRGVEKVIDFILVNGNLVFALTSHFVNDVSEFFDTDYKSVSISIGLDGLLDTYLIIEASKINGMVLNGVSLMELIKHLSVIRKKYRKSKYCKFKVAEDTTIKKTINHHIKNFCFNKGKMIKSILECLFYKVVLDYLVVDDELKQLVFPKIPDLWTRQYMPLNYVDDNAFSGTINEIGIEELSLVVDNLLNNKAKCCDGEILACFLKLLKLCLSMVLQDMHKAYNLVGWHHLRASLRCIKMCEHFIQFFGNIYEDWINRMMTDFGLLDGYRVHDGLDQGEVFSLLLWRIFYDPLLCKVKRYEHLCEYRIDSKFVAKSGRIEASREKTSFLAAGTFVDDMIWGLSKFSLAQAHKDVRFFSNIMLKKAITDKQFCYLVLAVLQSIVSYHIQFSFVTLDVCYNLRAKAGLPCDFSSEVLHHPSLYSLKPFKQSPLNSLQFFVKLCVSPINNFLAGVVKIFLENELSLANNLPCVFYRSSDFLMSGILGQSLNLVPYWFSLMSDFMNNSISLGVRATTATKEDVLSVLDSDEISEVCNSLLEMWSNCIKIYTDEFLRCVGSVKAADGVAAYFSAMNTGIEVKVTGFLSFTLTKLQAVVLALKTKHKVKIEKAGLIGDNGVVSGLSSCVVSTLSAGVVCMLSVIESFVVKFGRHKLCHFFSVLGGNAFVIIDV